MNKVVIGVGALLVLVVGTVLVTNRSTTESVVNSNQIEALPEIQRDFGALLVQSGPIEVPPEFRTIVNNTPFGSLDGVDIEGYYAQRFNVDANAKAQFQNKTDLDIATGTYHFIALDTNRLESGYAEVDEYGVGILPTGLNLSGQMNAEEPIVRNANQFAAFSQGVEGWSEVQSFDVQDNFLPTSDIDVYVFQSSSSDIVGFLVQDMSFGNSPIFTIQSFVRNTVEGQNPSANDPIGGNGFTFTPEGRVLDASIFADGFESGDVTQWSFSP